MDTPRIPTAPGFWWAHWADDDPQIVSVLLSADGALIVRFHGDEREWTLDQLSGEGLAFVVPVPSMSDAITSDEEEREFQRDARRLREMAERGELPRYA